MFIEGTLTRPAEAKDVDFSQTDAWDMANSMLCSSIINIIEPKLCLNVVYSETTYVMWNNLKKRYLVANTENTSTEGWYSGL